MVISEEQNVQDTIFEHTDYLKNDLEPKLKSDDPKINKEEISSAMKQTTDDLNNCLENLGDLQKDLQQIQDNLCTLREKLRDLLSKSGFDKEYTVLFRTLLEDIKERKVVDEINEKLQSIDKTEDSSHEADILTTIGVTSGNMFCIIRVQEFRDRILSRAASSVESIASAISQYRETSDFEQIAMTNIYLKNFFTVVTLQLKKNLAAVEINTANMTEMRRIIAVFINVHKSAMEMVTSKEVSGEVGALLNGIVGKYCMFDKDIEDSLLKYNTDTPVHQKAPSAKPVPVQPKPAAVAPVQPKPAAVQPKPTAAQVASVQPKPPAAQVAAVQPKPAVAQVAAVQPKPAAAQVAVASPVKKKLSVEEIYGKMWTPPSKPKSKQ
jgi:hypothetical protein